MARVSKKARRQAFERYAANLSLYHPSVVGQFLCPICRTVHGLDALDQPDPGVTVGHVVPQKLDGRVWTLECKCCNSRLGSDADAHLVKEHRFRQWEQAEGTWQGRLRMGDSEMGVEFDRANAGLHFREIAKQSDPRQSNALFRK